MMSEVHEAGDNGCDKEGQIALQELREELNRLRENDKERQDRMKELVKNNNKIRDELQVLERLLISNQDMVTRRKGGNTVKSENKSDQVNTPLNNHQLTNTLIKLTCECVVINKKFKYLRRLMKKNHKKLIDIRETSDAEVYFGSDMPVSSTVEVTNEEHEEEMPAEEAEEVGTRHISVKTEVVDDHPQYPDNSIYLELDDEQLMAIENGEMSIEDVTARAEAAASHHQQQMLAARESSREVSRVDDEDENSRGGDDSDEAEDEFDAFGRCVALQLKTLPIDSALELESQIHALITKKRMQLLKRNNKH